MKKCFLKNRIISFLLMAVLICANGLSFSCIRAYAVSQDVAIADNSATTDGSTSVGNRPTAPVRDVININSAADLEQLAHDCALDTYSENKYVQLNADIDLTDSSFSGIPIFNGEFEGNGHIVQGLKIKDKSANPGFFGIIKSNGIVKDLKIKGEIKPEGIVEAVGAIASRNEGMIVGCSFDGVVNNSTYRSDMDVAQITGGLVGINKAGAKISACSVSGEVSGLKYTGGIAGQNQGSIFDCSNDAEINTDTKDKKIRIKDVLNLKIKSTKDVLNIINFKKMYASENTGGITGYNTGNILGCKNNADVGTSQNGFNVGGIAGRNNGYVYDCTNSGDVCGNTNIGGITGQLEPYVHMSYTNMLLENPKAQVDDAFEIIDDTLGDIGSDISDVSNNISNVMSSINDALEISNELETTLTGVVNTKIEEVDGMVGTVNAEIEAANQLLSAVHEVTLGLENVSAGATTVTDHLKEGMGKINNSSGAVKDLGGKAADFAGSMLTKDPNTRNVKAKIEVYRNVESAWVADDETTAKAALENTNVSLLQNGFVMKDIALSEMVQESDSPYRICYGLCEVNDLPLADSEGHEYTYEVVPYGKNASWKWSINGNSSGYTVYLKHLGGFTNIYPLHIQWEDNHNEYQLRPSHVIVAAYYEGAEISINEYPYMENDIDSGDYQIDLGDLNPANPGVDIKKLVFKVMPCSFYGMGEMTQNDDGTNKVITCTYSPAVVPPTMEEIKRDINVIMTDTFAGIGDLTKAIQSVSDVTIALKNTFNRVNAVGMPTLATFPEFSTLPATLDHDIQRLIDEIQKVVSSVDGINGSLNTTQLDLTSNLRELTGQANLITDNIFDMVSSIPETLQSFLADGSGQIKTVSYSDVGAKCICGGTILDCENKGKIKGDTVVGGIVGTVALSGIPVIDVEDKDEDNDTIALPQITYQTTIATCKNVSGVYAENDYAGMICGKENMGSISDCTGYGKVASANGNYVGGVAGLAHGIIDNCDIKGDLAGQFYVGGIIGTGAEGNALVSGSKVTNCYSSVEVSEINQFSGAIAGADLGEFKNNYFYSDNLSGINSYSISGCYEPVYAERMNEEFSLEEMDMSKLDDEDKLVKTGAIILGFGAILVASIMLTALLKMRKKTKEKKQS